MRPPTLAAGEARRVEPSPVDAPTAVREALSGHLVGPVTEREQAVTAPFCIPERAEALADRGGMAPNRPPHRPLLAVLGALTRHPLFVALVLRLFERLLG